ncbi:MAG: DUF4164 family protein [Pseudomonadota bacterium]
MSSLVDAYQRLERAVDGLADAIDAQLAKSPNGAQAMNEAADEVVELRSECSRLATALQSASNRNAELDRVVDEIHRKLGATIADVDDLLRG